MGIWSPPYHQVLTNLTRSGGYEDLKRFDQQGLVEMQLRMYSRKIGILDIENYTLTGENTENIEVSRNSKQS